MSDLQAAFTEFDAKTGDLTESQFAMLVDGLVAEVRARHPQHSTTPEQPDPGDTIPDEANDEAEE